MTDAWHADLPQRATASRTFANRYGVAFFTPFLVTQIPAPSWLHWAAVFIGIVCSSAAYNHWTQSVTLRATSRMEPPNFIYITDRSD